MAAPQHIAPTPYVHPDDPAGRLRPGEPLIVDGFDWSWAFVVHRPIEGFPGYCVGSDGTVWSRRRCGKTPARFGSTWHRLKAKFLRGRYLQLTLRAKPGGNPSNHYVHRLVLNAFIGPRPEGMEACHGAGGSTDNRLCNLRWDTPQSNTRDKRDHGTMPLGEAHYAASLTTEDVIEMRWLKSVCPTLHFASIGWLYGVSPAVASRAIQGKRWSHVAGAVEVRYSNQMRRVLQVGLRHERST